MSLNVSMRRRRVDTDLGHPRESAMPGGLAVDVKALKNAGLGLSDLQGDLDELQPPRLDLVFGDLCGDRRVDHRTPRAAVRLLLAALAESCVAGHDRISCRGRPWWSAKSGFAPTLGAQSAARRHHARHPRRYRDDPAKVARHHLRPSSWRCARSTGAA
jgi:hypothetical protein